METTVLLTLLVQVVLPLAVGLVTKRSLPTNTKFLILAGLTAVNTGLIGFLGGSGLSELLLTGAVGLLASIGTHYGVYKPVGLSDKVQDVLVKDAPVADEEPAPEEGTDVGSEDAEAATEEDSAPESEQAVPEEADTSEEAEV